MLDQVAVKSMTAVVFDLDGTLVDSVGAITDIANALMLELRLPPLDVDEARGYIGNGAGRFVERALAARDALQPATIAKRLDRFNALYAEAPGEANTPFPGVESALRELAIGGHPLGLCTNKPLAPTLVVLEALGWERLFGAVIAGDVLSKRKPDPAPLLEAARRLGQKDVIYIGDSEVDAETALAAGMPFLLFTEGYRKSRVEALPHTAYFSDFAMLADLIGKTSKSL